MLSGAVIMPTSIDDDKLHIDEHIAFMLGADFKAENKKNDQLFAIFENHINEHRKNLKNKKEIEKE